MYRSGNLRVSDVIVVIENVFDFGNDLQIIFILPDICILKIVCSL